MLWMRAKDAKDAKDAEMDANNVFKVCCSCYTIILVVSQT